MLYPLSYEGVPIQYKAPRTASRHSPPKPPASTGSRASPIPSPNPCPSQCSPPEDTRTRRQNRSYNVRMSIYIDPPTWPAHGTVFSHLISDASLAELHEFAAAAGISERAFDRDHYDVPAHLYDELVRAGAVELSGAELTRTQGSTPLALILAAWFHDAVYEGAPGEDERRSEQLANTSLEPLVTAGLLSGDELQMVSLLVRATATHELPESADLPAGYEPADIQFFLDTDMAILAADSARYRRYLRGVRSEYSHFDDEAFRAGRMTFLRSILERERIFLSEEGLQLWEEPARANLHAELSEWEQDPQGLLQALTS